MTNKSDEEEEEVHRLPFLVPVLSWDGVFFVVFFQAWVHILPQRAQMFLQAPCQIQTRRLSLLHGRRKQQRKARGDTGHCNEHLRDVPR